MINLTPDMGLIIWGIEVKYLNSRDELKIDNQLIVKDWLNGDTGIIELKPCDFDGKFYISPSFIFDKNRRLACVMLEESSMKCINRDVGAFDRFLDEKHAVHQRYLRSINDIISKLNPNYEFKAWLDIRADTAYILVALNKMA